MSAGTVIIETRPCMVCGRRSRVITTAAQAEALNANAPVQDVFPRRAARRARGHHQRHAPELLGRNVRSATGR